MEEPAGSHAALRALPALTEAAADVQAELMDLLPVQARQRILDALAAVAYQGVPSADEPGA